MQKVLWPSCRSHGLGALPISSLYLCVCVGFDSNWSWCFVREAPSLFAVGEHHSLSLYVELSWCCCNLTAPIISPNPSPSLGMKTKQTRGAAHV